jgi:hypothetical protein
LGSRGWDSGVLRLLGTVLGGGGGGMAVAVVVAMVSYFTSR